MRLSTIFCFFLLISFQLKAQVVLIDEDFNMNSLPAGWTTSAISGAVTWSFGINSGNNIDGTGMAYFDDDILGNGSLNNTAELISPAFDNSSYNRTILSFDYNLRQLNGIQDSLYVDVFDGVNWITVFSQTTNDCGSWMGCRLAGFPDTTIDISSNANANCQVRFVYHDGNDWGFYAGIDNVLIASNVSNDIGVSNILTPVSACQRGTNELLNVTIENFGTDTIRNCVIVCDVNNGMNVYRDTVTSAIFPVDTLNYTFSMGVDLSNPDSSNLKVYTIEPLDTTPTNDTLQLTLLNDTSFLLPFLDDFESFNYWEVEGPNPSWELGIPMNSFIDSAFSGNNAYVTDLNGDYSNLEFSYLVSPCFNLSKLTAAPKVSFYLKFDTEATYDSLILEYTIDRGKVWHKVEPESIAINWHEQGRGWDGNSGSNWLKVENTLLSLVGESVVKFRFRFASDGGIHREGIAIDDFYIAEVDSVDLGITKLLNPTNESDSVCGSGNENVTVELLNRGYSVIDSTFLFYQVNGGTIFKDTVLVNIAPYSHVNYAFQNQYNFINPGTYAIKVWAETKGDSLTFNDTLNYSFGKTQSFAGYKLPYLERFDPPNFAAGDTFFNTNDSMGNGWSRSTSSIAGSSDFSWRVGNKMINRTKNTGPNHDYNGKGSFFAYTQTSFRSSLISRALLESPCIDLSGVTSATLSFRYHRFGEANMQPFRVEVLDGVNWVFLAEISDISQNDGSDPWSYFSASLSDFSGQKIKIRFTGVNTNTCCRYDMAIDNVLIQEKKAIDLTVTNLFVLQDKCYIADSMVVILRNEGFQSLSSNIPIAYSINGVAQNTNFILPSTLAPDSSISFTINQLNLSPQVDNELKVWVNFPLDQNSLNDSTQVFIDVKEQIGNSYFEDFDGFTDRYCNDFPNANLGDELQNGWQEKSLGFFRWHVQSASCNGTATSNTGPSKDQTTGRGNFMFTEATSVMLDTAKLESPCIDFSSENTAGLSFWYHRYGADMGAFFVDVFANGIWNLNIDSLTGQSHTSSSAPWLLKKIQFNQFAGQSIKVRFRMIYGLGEEGDMGIDDVEFYSPIQHDARLVDLSLQQSSCSDDSARLVLVTNNYGLDTIASNDLKVYYQINGNPVQILDSNAVVISIDSNLTFTTSISNLYGQGNNRITAWVELANDSNAFNDTLHYDFDRINRAPEYIEGFEALLTQAAQCGNFNPSLNLSWEIDSADQWVLGNHKLCSYNGSATPSVSSGPDSAYLEDGFIYFEPGFNSIVDTAILRSTCIDLRNDTNATLEFYYHMYGAGIGKLFVEGVTASGNWSRLDSIVGQNHFSGSDTWSLRVIPLNQFSGEVMRLRFIAIESGNSSISSQGNIALDDIRVHNALLTSLEKTVSDKNVILLFPNPTKGLFTVQLRSQYINNSYQLFDVNGRQVKIGRITNERTLVDLNSYTKGLYFLKVEGISEVKKIIIQ